METEWVSQEYQKDIRQYFFFKLLRGWEEKVLTYAGDNEVIHDLDVYRARLEKEIKMIFFLGVESYLISVADQIDAAKKMDCQVGAGRGSAAGSLVVWLLGITGIDPIKWDLLFERFLNPQRSEAPDIDVDFQDDKREQVRQYIRDFYGHDHVVDVCNFGTLGSRMVIRDIGRVMEMPSDLIDGVSKSMDDAKVSIETIYENNDSFRAFCDEYPEIWDVAKVLSGQARQIGKHAAGTLITPKPVWEYIPLQTNLEAGSNGGRTIVTAWDLDPDYAILDRCKVLKYDILGLSTLTITSKTLDFIKQRYDGKIIDFDKMREMRLFEDRQILREYAMGHTLGIFQFESGGIRKLLKSMRVSSFNDVIAANALFRPGPLSQQMHTVYCDRKNKIVKWEPEHPIIDKVVGYTYGVVIYQEQIMRILGDIGDYEDNEVDTVRRVLTKLQSSKTGEDNKGYLELQKLKNRYLEGGQKKGIEDEVLENIWAQAEGGSIYSFNRSHSAGYAVVSYYNMWLKTYYPIEFMASLMTVQGGGNTKSGDPKIKLYINECRRMNIKVLPPNVNYSKVDFSIADEPIEGNEDGETQPAIAFGLSFIKYVGAGAVKSIIENQPFQSLEDFIDKIDRRKLNRRALEFLSKAGAFSDFTEKKADAWNQILDIIDPPKKPRKNMTPEVAEEFRKKEKKRREELHVNWDFKEEMETEREALDFYLTGLEPFRRRRKNIKSIADTYGAETGEQFRFIGRVNYAATRVSKNDNEYGYVTFEDESGSARLFVWMDKWEEVKEKIKRGRIVLFRGEKMEGMEGADESNVSFTLACSAKDIEVLDE